MRPERAWVRFESGRRLNLLQPDPDSWTDRDLAIGLSRTYRWGGHSCWDLPLSVAQHSLLVLILRQKIAPLDRLTRGEAIITTGVGQHQMWAAQYFDFRSPRLWLTSGYPGRAGRHPARWGADGDWPWLR